LLDGPPARAEECATAIKAIASYPGQWAALNIVYLAASDDDAAALAAVEELNSAVRANW
jgi:hypothetical protein